MLLSTEKRRKKHFPISFTFYKKDTSGRYLRIFQRQITLGKTKNLRTMNAGKINFGSIGKYIGRSIQGIERSIWEQ